MSYHAKFQTILSTGEFLDRLISVEELTNQRIILQANVFVKARLQVKRVKKAVVRRIYG